MFSKTAEYALRSMVWLAKQEHVGFFKTTEIAVAVKVPVSYLSKILQLLNKANLIKARKGVNGGYALCRSAATISLFEIIDAVDPVRRILTCPLGIPCHKTICPLHQKLNDIHDEMRNKFESCYLVDLVSGETDPSLCGIK